jgi:hypothetical protein
VLLHPQRDRGEALVTVTQEVASAGSEMVVVTDTNAAAQHAARRRYINPESLKEIAQEEAQVERL